MYSQNMLCPLIVKHSFKWSYFELGDCTKGVIQKDVVQIGRCVIGFARDIEQGKLNYYFCFYQVYIIIKGR